MKKFIVGLFLICFTAAGVWAQPNEAKLWKTAKKEAKALESDGWVTDSSLPLENVLFNHYKKLVLEEGFQEVLGDVVGNTSVTTLNQAQQWSMTSACVQYSKSSGLTVRGRLLADVGAGIAGTPAADSFYEGYESTLEKEIRGELKKSFGVYKEKRGGGIDYKGYYLVNEESAHKARIRAMQMAMEESEFARQNAERISEFVRKGEF